MGVFETFLAMLAYTMDGLNGFPALTKTTNIRNYNNLAHNCMLW